MRPSARELISLLKIARSKESNSQNIYSDYEKLRNSRDPSKKHILDHISFENKLLSKFEEDMSLIENIFMSNDLNENSQPTSKMISYVGNPFISKIESRWNILTTRATKFVKKIQALKTQNDNLESKAEMISSNESEEKLRV